MTPRDKVGCIAGLVALGLTMPIGFYLYFRILQLVGATNVMWLLFWVWVPASIFVRVLAEIATHLPKDRE